MLSIFRLVKTDKVDQKATVKKDVVKVDGGNVCDRVPMKGRLSGKECLFLSI